MTEKASSSDNGFQSVKPPSSNIASTAASTIASTQRHMSMPVAMNRNRPVVVRIDALGSGQVFALKEVQVTIGRHPDNTIQIVDDGISRFHAGLKRAVGGGYVVEDLGSSNGSYVNGLRLQVAELGDGDTLQLGPKACFRFSMVSDHQEQVLKELYESSVRDALTGAHNRHYFGDRLAAEIAYAIRHQTPLSVLLLDIDHFKRVNDNHGHLAGDEVLRWLTQLLRQTLRAEDLFARYGGEEFICLLRGISIHEAGLAAERVRLAVAEVPAGFERTAIPVTVSVGASSLTCCVESLPLELIGIANRRLCAAKNGGRNRVVVAD